MMRVIKIIWIAVAILIILTGHFKRDAGPNSDLDLVIPVLIAIWGFPGGYFGIAGFGWLCLALERYGIRFPAAQMYLAWLVSFVCGYIQWFVVLPKTIQLVRYRGGRQQNQI